MTMQQNAQLVDPGVRQPHDSLRHDVLGRPQHQPTVGIAEIGRNLGQS